MLSTCEGVAADPERGGAEPGAGKQTDGHGRAGSGEERRQGLGVQEWPDGSRYEGRFVNGPKHGKGRYTWSNGEFYEGSFYRDYRHGDGVYCWPTGHKFTGKFYLNRKEGYGQQLFPDGATFQGLYHTDQRFGPGVVSYPDGREDVGLWHGGRLLRLCTSVEESFSLKNFPEYAAYMEPAATTDSLTQVHSPWGETVATVSPNGEQPPTRGLQTEARADWRVDTDGDLLSDENFILPPCTAMVSPAAPTEARTTECHAMAIPDLYSPWEVSEPLPIRPQPQPCPLPQRQPQSQRQGQHQPETEPEPEPEPPSRIHFILAELERHISVRGKQLEPPPLRPQSQLPSGTQKAESKNVADFNGLDSLLAQLEQTN